MMRTFALLLAASLLVLANGCSSADEGPTFKPPATNRESAGEKPVGTKVENPTPVILDSGVRIIDEVVGSGREARRGSVILARYTGTLENGTVFDQTDVNGPPAKFLLSTGPAGVIGGFVEGISGMREGGVRTMRIPWALGYGDESSKTIPSRSNLIFKVELVEVR